MNETKKKSNAFFFIKPSLNKQGQYKRNKAVLQISLAYENKMFEQNYGAAAANSDLFELVSFSKPKAGLGDILSALRFF